MISLIEALNYRCLRYVRQELGAFHLLVGPNASGKTTFLDVVGFLHDLVTEGLEEAIRSRSANFYDLVWRQTGHRFEIGLEAPIPAPQREMLRDKQYDTVRYEIAIQMDAASNDVGIAAEQAILKVEKSAASPARADLPASRKGPETILTYEEGGGVRFLFGSPVSSSEFTQRFGGDMAVIVAEGQEQESSFRVMRPGTKRCLLANVPENAAKFPVSTWLRQLLCDGVEPIALESRQLRRPSPPGQGIAFKPDGSNLPWVVWDLERKSPERLKEWLAHLQTALPDLAEVKTVERPEDRHRYLTLAYGGALKVPSWNVSDGTLRLLSLTLPAYLPEFRGILLVEEPENGLHPLAIETAYQSLSSVYDGQVLLATHCPLLVAVAKPSEVLCFSKDSESATQIVSGDRHPELSDWRGEVNLGTLFAAGVLG
jgi:predicted ATPase